MSILKILKNAAGEFEVGRTILTTGSAAAVTSPIGFEAWHMWHGGAFDVTAWCLSYPGGLAALVSSGVISIGAKDRSVAIARQTAAQPPLDDTTGSSK